MSNVLVGIIGVVLFIGLALAGSVTLGPRFLEASYNSKASSVIQAMAQAVSAIRLYEAKAGTSLIASNHDTNIRRLAELGYLRSEVRNPLDGSLIATVDVNGNDANLPVDHVHMLVGYQSDPTATAICAAIERQSANRETITSVTNWGQHISQNRRPGCVLYTLPARAEYHAYMPI